MHNNGFLSFVGGANDVESGTELTDHLSSIGQESSYLSARLFLFCPYQEMFAIDGKLHFAWLERELAEAYSVQLGFLKDIQDHNLRRSTGVTVDIEQPRTGAIKGKGIVNEAFIGIYGLQ